MDDFETLLRALKRYQVTMVGSGAWACAAVRLAAQNTLIHDRFCDEIKMWVYEESIDGTPLTHIINTAHENVKYLPGVFLGDNVKAVASLKEAVHDCDILIICLPHQFVGGIVRKIRGLVSPDAIAVSLTKGMRVRPGGPQLISDLVRKELGLDCSVLMGANIAEEIARDELSEATIGYNIYDNAHLLQKLFETEHFYVSLVPDVVGPEMCGTLKNIVALGAGFVAGLGLGNNTHAAILRAGLGEIMKLAKAVNPSVRNETFFEACGVADLIASCSGGRNRLVAKEYAERKGRSDGDGVGVSFEGLEEELLQGQKLQGALTSDEVQLILKKNKWEGDYPLFTTINRIVNGELPPSAILKYKQVPVAAVLKGSASSSTVRDDESIRNGDI